MKPLTAISTRTTTPESRLHTECHEWLEELCFIQEESLFLEHIMRSTCSSRNAPVRKHTVEIKQQGLNYWQKLLSMQKAVIQLHQKNLEHIRAKPSLHKDTNLLRVHKKLKKEIRKTVHLFINYKEILIGRILDLT
jgi:hypothetical protein